MASMAPSSSTVSSTSSNTIPPKSTLSAPKQLHTVTRLSSQDLLIVWQALGGVSDSSSHSLVRPKSIIYPPKGLPDGLYRDVIQDRTVSLYQYCIVAFCFNLLLILQLLLGASMTALSSTATPKDVPITIIAAANTVIAGLLALLHNSGLPDRYKKDGNEFDNVEMYMRELMESGLVKDGISRDEVIENCFEMYRRAKMTVSKNKPAAYATSTKSAEDSNEHIV